MWKLLNYLLNKTMNERMKQPEINGYVMEHWIEGYSENGYGEKGILIKEADRRILSVVKNEDGIQFMEECDGYFSHTYTKEDALRLVDELLEWINSPILVKKNEKTLHNNANK